MIWETVVSISHIFVAIAVAVAVAAAVLYLPLTSFGCEKNCLYTCPYSISKFFSIKYPSFLFSTEMLKSGPLCTLSFAHMCFLSFCKWKQNNFASMICIFEHFHVRSIVLFCLFLFSVIYIFILLSVVGLYQRQMKVINGFICVCVFVTIGQNGKWCRESKTEMCNLWTFQRISKRLVIL